MEAIPPFTHLRFFEISQQALKLRSDLSARFPDDDRYVVINEDCNATISRTLHDLRAQGLDFSPTFCFIDPDALDVDWSTLSTVASFKNSLARTKPEMLILLSHTTIPRLAGWDSSMGLDEELSSAVTAFYGTQDWRHIHSRRTRDGLGADDARTLYTELFRWDSSMGLDEELSSAVTAFYGTQDWRHIHSRRTRDGLGADDARTLYTELFRYRIQQVLGYRRTLTIEMGNERGAPVYVLVFCTDHDAGVRIMSSVFAEAREQSAVSRALVTENRKREAREKAGTPSLFDNVDEAATVPPLYFESTQTDEFPTLPTWLLEHLADD